MKKRLIDALNIAFARFLEKYYRITKRFHSPSSKVLISGAPRGGTTWFAELLLTIENSNLFWEPLRPFRMREIRKSDFSKELGWFPYIPVDADWPEADVFFKRLLNCERLNYKSILQYNSFKSTLKARYMIIKCVTANKMLPWINSHSDIKTIYLLRHPCAVVASQLRFDSFKDTHKREFFETRGKYSDLHDAYGDVITSLESKEEILAALWCFQNIVPLTQPCTNGNRLTVFYEFLVENPLVEITRVFDFIEKPLPKNIENQFSKPSFTTVQDAQIQKGGNQLSGWKEYLDNNQIERILSVLNKFDIDLYTAELLPNKSSSLYPE